jgi:hypothetical protein
MNIISKLAGGIGNQLFQYAFGASIANKFNADFHVNVESFNNYAYHHEFELSNLIMGLSINNDSVISGGVGNYFLAESAAVPSLDSIGTLPTNCSNLVINGYWQNEAYFNSKVVGEMYESLEALALRILPTSDEDLADFKHGIGVHIRRRDYAHMGICSEEYYIGCLLALFDRNPDRRIYLFSDEPNYSMSFLSPYFDKKITLVKTGSDWTDLYLMSIMRDLIISNSTFSWWGAYFNESHKDNIFCPNPWLLIDSNIRPCPDRWHAVRDVTHPRLIISDVVQKIRSVSAQLIRF